MRSGAGLGVGAAGLALVGCGDDDDDGGDGATSPTSAGGATAAAKPVPVGGKLAVAESLDPTSLDPQFGQGGGDHQFFWAIHDNLVNYNQKGELDASVSLAEKWELPDPTTVTMKLRAGVKFHDGTPFNADAVKFNVDRAQAQTSAARAQMLPIIKVEAISDTEIKLTLNKPNAAILTLLGDRGGAIVSPAAAQKYGTDYARNPVGTGKMVFKEWAQNSHILVTKNPNYWGTDAAGTKLPYLDEIRWNFIPDATVRTANLESGTAAITVLGLADVDRFSKDSRFNVQKSATAAGWTGFYANQSNPPIDNRNLRRALTFATDNAAFVQAVAFGLATPGAGPIAPGTWAYNPEIKGLGFNAAEAKKALDASGLGPNVEVEVVTIKSATNEQIAELWKAMMAKIGVTLKIVPVQVAELTQRSFVGKSAQINGTGFSLRADPDGTISECLRSDGFYNPGHKPNAELDSLIDKARETYNQQERKSFYDRIQKIAIEEVYNYYLYYAFGYVAANKKVLNLDKFFGGETKPRWANLALQA